MRWYDYMNNIADALTVLGEHLTVVVIGYIELIILVILLGMKWGKKERKKSIQPR